MKTKQISSQSAAKTEPISKRYRNNWVVGVDGHFELHHLSRFVYPWGRASSIQQAMNLINAREDGLN